MTTETKQQLVSDLRRLHAEIVESDDGWESPMMALIRRAADALSSPETKATLTSNERTLIDFRVEHGKLIWTTDGGGSRDATAAELLMFEEIKRLSAVETECDEAHTLAMEFDHLLNDTLVPNEPLEVYTSNSYRRVGLKSRYHEVLYAARDRSDGHPNFSNYALLDALVCAFNAMLARRAVKSVGEPK